MNDAQHLLIFADPGIAHQLDRSALAALGYEISTISRLEELETSLDEDPNATVILAHPTSSHGLDLITRVLSAHPKVSVILVTDNVDLPLVRRGLQIGLVDYLVTPVDLSDLHAALERANKRQKSSFTEHQLEHVILSLQDGFVCTDLNFHIRLINPIARQIFNITDEPVEGKAINEVIFNADLLDIFMPDRTFPYNNEITIDDGHIYCAHSSRITGWGISVIMQDITHHKELDRDKTDFINTISHDLRSPLTSIYGFIGLIDRVGPINRQQAEFIKHIQSSVQHITALVNDLLDLNRVEAGYDLQMVEVQMKNILVQTISSLEYQSSEKMLDVVLDAPDDLPAVMGNPLHLQRMVANLVDNAIKFTPPMGRVEIHCRDESRQLILEVADNGPGIPLIDQPHIFNKFYRGSNLSQVTAGTGLGLSIAKSIVEKHGGRIWLESSPLGTTFTVILPLAKSP
jgi:two-component system NtrC family sensor kinase